MHKSPVVYRRFTAYSAPRPMNSMLDRLWTPKFDHETKNSHFSNRNRVGRACFDCACTRPSFRLSIAACANADCNCEAASSRSGGYRRSCPDPPKGNPRANASSDTSTDIDAACCTINAVAIASKSAHTERDENGGTATTNATPAPADATSTYSSRAYTQPKSDRNQPERVRCTAI